MLIARVCDPLGPRWVRFLRRCLAVGAVFLAIVLLLALFQSVIAAGAAFLLLAATLLVSRRLPGARGTTRSARIIVGEGRIDIRHAGLLRQRIYATDVVAASTARMSGGVTLALVRRHAKTRPLLLDLASDDDLDTIRKALRIGHFGFGEISWPVGAAQHKGTIVGGAGLAAFATVTFLLQFESPWLAIPLSSALIPAIFGYFVFLLWRFANPAPKPRVALTRHGLLLAEPNATITYVPYANVVDAWIPTGPLVYVRTDGNPLNIPMDKTVPQEREHLVAQLRSAAQRARGEGPRPAGVPASVAMLAPRDKPDREWLERLDATAAALSSVPTSAYRRPDIDAGDLAKALASPDAPAPIRAAAARVLARIAPEEATVQIARVLAEERDSETRALLRVALEEDVDTAARVLDGWRSSGM